MSGIFQFFSKNVRTISFPFDVMNVDLTNVDTLSYRSLMEIKVFHDGCCGALGPLDTTLIVIIDVSGWGGIGKTQVCYSLVLQLSRYDVVLA